MSIDVEKIAEELEFRPFVYQSGEVEWGGSDGSEGITSADLKRFAAAIRREALLEAWEAAGGFPDAFPSGPAYDKSVFYLIRQLGAEIDRLRALIEAQKP